MTTIKIDPITIPGGLFNEATFRKVLRNVRTARAKAIEVDFATTTQTWSTRPTVHVQNIGDASALIFITDLIYGFVNDGTRPHPIRPKAATRLVFQANYKSKTITNFIGSRPGGPFGPTVYSQGVMHPGTTGRFFDVAIAAKWNKLLPPIIERAILAAL